MPLTITDFIEQVEGLQTSDISEKNRRRINDALADLTGGPGGSAAPINNNGILVSKSLNGRAGFTSIQDALDGTNPQNGASGADSGDTIFVEQGTYRENLSITTDDLTIKPTQGLGSVTLEADASVSTRAIEVDGASGLNLEQLEITFDGTQSPNAEKYGIRALAGSDGLTVRDCAIIDFSTSENGRDGTDGNDVDAVRATGITVTANEGSGPSITGPLIQGNLIADIECVGVTTDDGENDSDSKAKGIALAGDVQGASIFDNDIFAIGTASNDPSGAQISRPGNGASGTDKPRGISIVQGGASAGPTDFVIGGNDLGGPGDDAIVGTFGQPALFVGGTNGLGDHLVVDNEFYHPVDNLSADPLNLENNSYFDTDGTLKETPDLVPADQDEDGGNLIDRGTSGSRDSYNLSPGGGA